MGEFVLQTNAACSNSCPEFAGSDAQALALQPDGKLLIAAQDFNYGAHEEGPRSTIVRLDDHGTLDDTFGSGGLVPAPFEVRSLYPQTDGSLVSVGVNDNKVVFDGEVGIEHYTASGVPAALVQWFTMPGTLGEPIAAFTPEIDGAGRLVVGGDKIVFLVPHGDEPDLVRFFPTGAPDASFGSDGIVSLRAPSKAELPPSAPDAFALRKDGSLFVATTTYDDSAEEKKAHTVLYHFTSNGKLDPHFGRGGMVALPSSGDYEAIALAVTPGGGVVLAAGEVLSGSSVRAQLLIMRYTKAGQPDSSFGRKGVVTRTWSSQEATFQRAHATPISVVPSAMAFDARGDIVVAGTRATFVPDTGSVKSWVLARLTPSGFDCAFGSSGVAIGSAGASANAVAVQADGRIVIAGERDHELVSARYMGGGMPRTCPGDHKNHRPKHKHRHQRQRHR